MDFEERKKKLEEDLEDYRKAIESAEAALAETEALFRAQEAGIPEDELPEEVEDGAEWMIIF